MDRMRFHKTAALVLTLLLAMVVLTPAIAQQNGQAEVMLQAAHNKQLVDGDLAQAIRMYKKILSEYSSNRPVAARALVEMGDCYEKLGKSEALKAYQRVVRDYADQSAEANQARARLAALEHGTHGNEMVMRRIWAGSGVDYEGAPTPDGKYLPYVDWGTGDLAIRNLATGQETRLTHKGPWTESGDFAEYSVPSPDGKEVAYAWFHGDGYGLRVIDIDGSDMRILSKTEHNGYVEPKAWTPDGKQILAIIWPKDGSMQVGLVSAADGTVRALRSFPRGDPHQRLLMFSQLCISPSGRYIAYSQLQKGDETHHDVYLLPIDGGKELPVVTNPADDYFLGWAPGGKTMVFASDRTGPICAWAVKVLDGKPAGLPRLLKPDVGRLLPLGFTRDGSFYYALNDTVRDLYVASLDFTSGKVLEPPRPVSRRFTGRNAAPAWSPDGKYIAYLSLRHRSRMPLNQNLADTIVIRSLKTGEEREVVPKIADLRPFPGLRWSADGHSFLVVGSDAEGRRGVFRIDAGTGKASLLLSHGPGGVISCLTPDEKSLVYAQSGPNGVRVLVRDLTTGHVRKLVPARDWLSGLALSPDGRRIAFDTQAEHAKLPALNVVSVAGGEPRTLYTLKRPTGFAWNSLAWTPDGKRLVFGVTAGGLVPGGKKADVWEISAAGGEPQKLDLTADTMRKLRVSPDGHHVAFESGAFSSEIDVMQNILPALKASR